MIRLARRDFLAASLATLAFPAMSQERLRVDITRGKIEPISIAVTDLVGTGGGDLSKIIADDLRRSGLFQPVDRKAFVEDIQNPDAPPNFGAWRSINTAAVVVGKVVSDGATITADFRLWDALSGQQLVGQQYSAAASTKRRIAHIVADAIFEALTGEKGHFDTRIAFVDESGPKDRRSKRLAIMDQDGANVRFLTKSSADSLVLTPRFSPTNQQLTYMQFGEGDPRVFLLDLESGQRETVGNFAGMTFSPRFSPDGRQVVFSMEQNGSANLMIMDLASKSPRQLSNSGSIDTAPSFAPDGTRIAFESDRGGSQQIYVMGADGSGATRVSFGDGRYSTPVWSPRGDLIAFTRQAGGRFGIGVMKPDGSGERILTESFHNEGPTWSPNGLYLMFFRDVGDGPKLWMVSILGFPEQRIPTPNFASDPAWSPTLG